MSKQLLKKELILIDFVKNEFKFFNIELLSVGYNQLQIITNYGKLGNKGTENIYRVTELKEAYKIFYRKIYEKKDLGYLSRRKVSEAITAATSFIRKEESQKDFTKNDMKKFHCSLCNKELKKSTYEKINQWARGEANWDKDFKFIGYKKVLCVECQIEHDIFKKKM